MDSRIAAIFTAFLYLLMFAIFARAIMSWFPMNPQNPFAQLVRQIKAFHRPPDAPTGYDYLICESTYGARDRADYTLAERRKALREELSMALERGGNVVIPSFAVERSQELLHDIGALMLEGALPRATVFLDSPLASKVTRVFIKHAGSLDDLDVPEEKLFRHRNFRIVESVDESKAINRIDGGAIIISASGMCDAGRIKHHLRNNLWRRDATVLFVGYQAPGTLGNVIVSGTEKVRIHGREIKVGARIRQIGNYSAHADQGELISWIESRLPVAGALFLNHGEDEGRDTLRDLLIQRGMPAERIYMPELDEAYELEAGPPASKGRAAVRVPHEQMARDWDNDYAAFNIDLAARLKAAEDPAEKRALLARLRAVLED